MHEQLSVYDKWIGVRLSKIILMLLIITSLIFGYLYYTGDLNDRATALYGGLITSLFAVVIQFLMGWNEHREMERIKKMGIYRILPDRDGKQEYYYQLLKVATKNIDFLGATANSFLNDFAGDVGAGDRATALTTALQKDVKVRILIPSKQCLAEDKYPKHEAAKIKLELLKQKYDTFSFAYLDRAPSYTLVRADNECIVGSIIPGIGSGITSAIHASIKSPFLKCYLDDFEKQCEQLS